MQAVTGRDVMVVLLELATDISRWNKMNLSGCAVNGYVQQAGLTKNQMELLGFLYGNERLNTVSALAAELMISKGSLSLMLTKLKRLGFVAKDAPVGDDDGRKVYISLTQKGREAVEGMMDVILENGARAFDDMNEENRTSFFHKVEELKEIFNLGGWNV